MWLHVSGIFLIVATHTVQNLALEDFFNEFYNFVLFW